MRISWNYTQTSNRQERKKGDKNQKVKGKKPAP